MTYSHYFFPFRLFGTIEKWEATTEVKNCLKIIPFLVDEVLL